MYVDKRCKNGAIGWVDITYSIFHMILKYSNMNEMR